jgi:hypothetical protein
MGPAKLRHSLFVGNPSVDFPEEMCRKLVYFYRDIFAAIPRFWATCESWLGRMILAKNPNHPSYDAIMALQAPSLPTCISAQVDAIRLPNGLAIQYPGLRVERDTEGVSQLVYEAKGEHVTKKIYGAKMVENITQALARIVVTDAALKVHHETGYRPFMSTYDSHDYIVPEREVEWFDRYLAQQFAIAPAWLPDVPLASEGGWGRNLLEAEKGVNV